jgi:beta-lactamase class A
MLSSGCARDWTGILAALHRGEVVSAGVSRQVLDWLALGADLSMVASAFALDPLAHVTEDLGLRLWNKTGTDAGVRADVGLVRSGQRVVAYAAICSWDDTGATDARREVLAGLRAVGEQVRDFLHAEAGSGPG